jgi:hypothetical protein
MSFLSKIFGSRTKNSTSNHYTDPKLQSAHPSSKETPLLLNPSNTTNSEIPVAVNHLPPSLAVSNVPITEVIDVIPPDIPDFDQDLIQKEKPVSEVVDYLTVDTHVFKEISKYKPKRNEISQRGVDPILIPSLLELLVPYKHAIADVLQSGQYEVAHQYYHYYMALNPIDLETKIEYVWFLIQQMKQVGQAWTFFHTEILEKYPMEPFVLRHAYSLYYHLQAYSQAYDIIDLLINIDLMNQNDWLLQKKQLWAELIENQEIQANHPAFYQKLQQDHFSFNQS